MGIDERLVSRPHLLPSRFTRTGSDGDRLTSRNGKNRTLRPSKDHSTKRKRSRTRLQIVLREKWCWRPAAFWWKSGVPHDAPSHGRPRGDRAPYRTLFSVSCADPLYREY